MDIDTNITIGFGEKYISLTPLEINYDKSWGTTFNILKWNLRHTEREMQDVTFALFSYTNTQYLHQLEIMGVKLITKFK